MVLVQSLHGQLLPTTVYMAQKFCCREGKASFEVFPVCKQCGAVWKYNNCIEGSGRSKTAKLCSHVDPLDKQKTTVQWNSFENC